MTRYFFTTTLALAMMTSVAIAQTSSSSVTSTQSTIPPSAGMIGASSATRTQHTTNSDGEKTDSTTTHTTGTYITPSGNAVTTDKKTETTTIH